MAEKVVVPRLAFSSLRMGVKWGSAGIWCKGKQGAGQDAHGVSGFSEDRKVCGRQFPWFGEMAVFGVFDCFGEFGGFWAGAGGGDAPNL